MDDAQKLQIVLTVVAIITGGLALWRNYRKEMRSTTSDVQNVLLTDYNRIKAERDVQLVEIAELKKRIECLEYVIKEVVRQDVPKKEAA